MEAVMLLKSIHKGKQSQQITGIQTSSQAWKHW